MPRHPILIITFVCAVLELVGCGGPEIRGKSISHETLPTGEIISKETWVIGDDPAYSTEHCQLYFQPSSSVSMEKMGPDIPGVIPDLASPTKLIFREGDSVILLVGHHIFRRSLLEKKPWWYQTTTNPDGGAAGYLRSFIPRNDPRLPKRSDWDVKIGSFTTPAIESLEYAFERFEPIQDILTTKRVTSDENFPNLLVYSRALYGDSWKFDLERTRNANSLPVPPDPKLQVELSIITYPGAFQSISTNDNRDAALALSGAKEVFQGKLPLSAATWQTFDYTLTIPTGVVLSQHFETMFGFWDPEPGYFSILWRGHELSGSPEILTTKSDVWTNIDASGYEGSLNEVVFFRVQTAD